MNQFMLQLGIILQPCLAAPDAPLGHHETAEFQSLGGACRFGGREASILRKTGALLQPAAGA